MGFLKVFVLASLVLSIAACGGRNEAQIVEKEIAYSADGTSLKGFIASVKTKLCIR